jgi:hypothetical protein
MPPIETVITWIILLPVVVGMAVFALCFLLPFVCYLFFIFCVVMFFTMFYTMKTMLCKQIANISNSPYFARDETFWDVFWARAMLGGVLGITYTISLLSG